MDDVAPEPCFWACELKSGETLKQRIPRGSCVFLTSANVAPGERGSAMLWADSGGFRAVLGTLHAETPHGEVRLGQPFASDVTFSAAAPNAPAIHLSGYSRGRLGKLVAERMHAAVEKKGAAAGESARGAAAAAPAKAKTIAAGAKAVNVAELLGVDGGDDSLDDEDDDDEYGDAGADDAADVEEEEPPAAKRAKTSAAAPARAVAPPNPAPAPAKPAVKPTDKPAAKPAAQPAAAAKPAAKPAPKPRVLQGGLQVLETREGGGGQARRGMRVNVRYAGTLTNGKQFDAGTIKFRLGGGEVIRGWDVGVDGMRVGGKRRLTIPPALAYGARPPRRANARARRSSTPCTHHYVTSARSRRSARLAAGHPAQRNA